MMLYIPVDNFLVMTIPCLPGVLNQYLGHNACSDSDGGESRTSIRFDLQSTGLTLYHLRESSIRGYAFDKNTISDFTSTALGTYAINFTALRKPDDQCAGILEI